MAKTLVKKTEKKKLKLTERVITDILDERPEIVEKNKISREGHALLLNYSAIKYNKESKGDVMHLDYFNKALSNLGYKVSSRV